MGLNKNNNIIICENVISASLTMITVVAAFTVYITDKMEVGFLYYLITLACFLSFVTSIFLGGKGLSWSGIENNKGNNPFFNWQAITTLLGVLFFCISPFLTHKKVNEFNLSEYSLMTIHEIKAKDQIRTNEIEHLKRELNLLNNKFDKIILENNRHESK
jgi:hypothetical protein